MRHFVQYHNPDQMGEYEPPVEDDYGIVTNKKPACEEGHRVWLISRQGNSGSYRYFLCETFLVDSIAQEKGRGFHYSVKGRIGKTLNNILIDQEDWFPRLRTLDGNFAFGLQPIDDSAVVNGLSKFI